MSWSSAARRISSISRWSQPERLRDHHGVGGNLLRMSLRVVVLGVDRERERRDGLDHRRRQRVARASPPCSLERAGELLEAAVNFLESLGAGGEQALQRDAQIRFEHIFLPSLPVVRIALLGARNGIPALVLGEVHRRIGHLDEFLRRGAVHRETRRCRSWR